MPYIPNPDTQPGKPGGGNQQSRENQAHGAGGQRVNTGKNSTGTALSRWVSAFGVSAEYSRATVLVGDSIGVPREGRLVPGSGPANEYETIPFAGYGTGGYSRQGYSI